MPVLLLFTPPAWCQDARERGRRVVREHAGKLQALVILSGGPQGPAGSEESARQVGGAGRSAGEETAPRPEDPSLPLLGDPGQEAARRYGLRRGGTGAQVLVRPDGLIAARCPGLDVRRHHWLRDALARMLGFDAGSTRTGGKMTEQMVTEETVTE